MDAATARFSELARECGRLEVRVETLESLLEGVRETLDRWAAEWESDDTDSLVSRQRARALAARIQQELDRAKSNDV